MPPIRSINEPRITPRDDGQKVPAILTQAVAEPPKPTTTYYTNERVLGMTIFQDHLFVATENGVYSRSDVDGVFKRLKFEIVEEPSE
jgi:hypothetical protein